jgi:hypothetical protein
MAENRQKNTEKKPEKTISETRKPRRIREIMLRTMQILMIYTRPVTITGLVAILENEGYPVRKKMMREKLIKEIGTYPPAGFELVVKMERVGTNKQVPAYQLFKISQNVKKRV